ncbi:MAG TPA: DNA polymerase I, partial [Acidobacteriota bacterium]|nr:DNA polymerase I [Acidobacteriota bacterium]
MNRAELQKVKKPRFYIVDGNGYIYRAFFALPKMNNSKGIPTNAVYGFTNMIRKLINEEKPDYLAVAFDAKERTFRHDSYEAYKVDRPQMAEDLQQQIPYIRRICEALGLPVIQQSGYEADDVIATMMEQCKKKGLIGVIVTSDKDLFQLVEDRSDVYTLDPMKEYFVYDEQAVQEKWGVKPDRIVEVLSIMGDSIDNIPGVKGIGPKGAMELIQQFGTVENLLANIGKIEKKSHRQKIEEYQRDLILSKQLIQLRKDVPVQVKIQDLKVGKPDRALARSLFHELEFYSILNEYLSGIEDRGVSYNVIETQQQLEEMIGRLSDSKIIAVHVEIESECSFFGNLIGVAFSNNSKSGWYVPVGHQGLGAESQLDPKYVVQKLRRVLEDSSIEKTAFNLKLLKLIFYNHGIALRGAKFDPMLMSYVLNPTRHSHKIEDIAKEYLQYQTLNLKSIFGGGSKQTTTPASEIQALGKFCCEKADLALELAQLLRGDLQKEKLEQLYFNLELPVMDVLVQLEWNGVKISTATLERLSVEMSKNLNRLVEQIYNLAGGEFNINSPKQIGEVLFHRLKLPMVKKTRKTKDFSTSVEVLEELAKEYDLPQKILEYRQFAKLKSTYVDALPAMIQPRTGRVHTNYQQTVAATGRLSSVDPNLQNIPIRTPWGRLIRDAFVAEQGNCLLSADYSQIELRVMAHLSGDQTLIDSFLKNEDIHARTASEVFGVPMEQMTKETRNRAKAINYGINYGQSPFGLAQLLGIDQKEAREFIDRYFTKYAKVKEYLD